MFWSIRFLKNWCPILFNWSQKVVNGKIGVDYKWTQTFKYELTLGRGNIGIELVPNGCDRMRKAVNQIDNGYYKNYQYINLIIWNNIKSHMV
jgi:hypothetical protein